MKLYVDIDGCLTDFDGAVEKLGDEFALGLKEGATEEQRNKMYKAIEKAGEKFWADMKWKNDGKKLWNLVKPFSPTLLSSPGQFSEAESGKTLWVKRNIPGTPLFLSTTKSEYVDPFCQCILIDDTKANTDAWEIAGGEAILHKDAESTERQLLEMIWDVPPQIDIIEKFRGKKQSYFNFEKL